MASVHPFNRIRQFLPWIAWGLGAILLSGLLAYGLGGPVLWQWLEDQIQDTGALQNFLGSLAQVLSGVLGFTISVVAIVVQLSAERFTPKVTELFLRERINFWIILYLIIANVVVICSSFYLSLVPKAILLAAFNLILGIISFALLIPYFIFVFNFLQPTSIVRKIEQQIRQSVISAFATHLTEFQIIQAHQQFLSALDEIKDIAISASQKKESSILLDALDSLKAFAIFFGTYKHKLPPAWFHLTHPVQRDPDFVSVDGHKLSEIEAKQTWVELKIFRHYQSIFTGSLNEFRDACYIIGINTREIAELTLSLKKPELTDLAIIFFNTYLRAVINSRDVRTGYNILKQYRLIAECALKYQQESIALEIAQYFRYYSLLSFKSGLFFLSETFAFDLSQLAQSCCQYQSSISQEVLEIFLKIDQDPEGEQQENTLRGIRKSQAMLAAYYLNRGLTDLAQLIFQDMSNEPPSRLKIIYEELQTTRADFWEFTDRGENFYYVDPALQPFVTTFFSWFNLSLKN